MFLPRNKKGFTLILALMVMILLSTLMALFITMVTVNLKQSQNALKVSTVELLASNGIDYCDNMLLHSPSGADWRPAPSNISMKDDWLPNLSNPKPLETDVASDLKSVSEDDPDYQWLMAYWYEELKTVDGIVFAGPSGGYTRVDSGDGRFLVRVSYTPATYNIADTKYYPNYYDMESKYIKIESIGRLGFVDPDDPTTMKPYGNPNKRMYLVAYKPIAITDYMRFVTNKDNKKITFNLGSDVVSEVYGRSNTRYSYRGAPIRVQGDLYFDPNTTVYLRGREMDNGSGGKIVSPRDLIEVTGDIINDSLSFVNLFDVDGDTSTPLDSGISKNRFVKSGGASTGDGVTNIGAPEIDTKDTSNTTLRYRALTKGSGKVIAATGKNSGEFGWGSGIYIDNKTDVQRESETLFGGYSLRADWLNPGNLFSKNWQGPYYIPPGVIVVLNPDVANGITITRTDFDVMNINKVWRDATGIPRPEWGATINVPYPIDGEVRSFDGTAYPKWIDPNERKIMGNGVIFAEGNIRIKGMLPKNVQLTVVSNENIYIEGNILKYREPGTPINAALDVIGQTSSPVDHSSSISLLAKNNVVVNTTMFLSPQMSLGPDDVASDVDGSNEPPYHLSLSGLDYGRRFQWSFMFGPYESEKDLFPNVLSDGWRLLMRHSSQYGYVDAYLDTFFNDDYKWKSIDWGEALNSNPYYPSSFTNKLRINGGLNWNSMVTDSNWIYSFNIYRFIANDFSNSSVPNVNEFEFFRIFLDNYSKGDYILGNVAVNPMDIRIEALNYAQDGSFFVIPGYWFNPDPNYKNKDYWILGDPLDVKITIDGAISENIVADKSDQRSWMEKWGKTFDPTLSKTLNVDSYHDGSGFTILYDDHLAFPIVNDQPIRYDKYARLLPITPKLPVSTTLIYKGAVE